MMGPHGTASAVNWLRPPGSPARTAASPALRAPAAPKLLGWCSAGDGSPAPTSGSTAGGRPGHGLRHERRAVLLGLNHRARGGFSGIAPTASRAGARGNHHHYRADGSQLVSTAAHPGAGSAWRVTRHRRTARTQGDGSNLALDAGAHGAGERGRLLSYLGTAAGRTGPYGLRLTGQAPLGAVPMHAHLVVPGGVRRQRPTLFLARRRREGRGPRGRPVSRVAGRLPGP